MDAPKCLLWVLLLGGSLFPFSGSFADKPTPIPAPIATVDLAANDSDYTLHPIAGDVGGVALVGNFQSHPTGTGVFDPFLTINSNGSNPTEKGYNTDGHTALYMDQQRPTWNTYVRLSDLAVINVGGKDYYAFELDANEPGNKKSLISIDNIRIYTSSTDNTALVGNDESRLGLLGTLRFSLNQGPTPENAPKWIKLDANQNGGPNGGSGFSDMIFYVPVTAFAGASLNDYLWFFNLNGLRYGADPNLAAQAGYEEWRAVRGPNAPTRVPDGGSTLVLLGMILPIVAWLNRWRGRVRA